MTEERFSKWVKWGEMLLVIGVIANLYFVIRYREICIEASEFDRRYAQQMAMTGVEQQVLESIIRDFANKAGNEPGVTEILRKHGLMASNGGAKPAAHKP